MNTQLLKFIFVSAITVAMCAGFYLLGKSQAETKIVKEQVEVIRYVERQKADIYSKPNAHRNELLERMRKGKL